MDYREKYESWLKDDYFDEDTKNELEGLTDDDDEILDRFYTDLKFGTAGLRGKIGAGTNRMNKYTVALATQGLAQTIVKHGKEAMDRGVAIAYDVRWFSDEFAKIAARVLAANGVKAYLFDGIRPTPMLSYTVRRLNCISGIVVTASHNPRDYNGYKVYWEEGSQILDNIADDILDEIASIESFGNINYADYDQSIEKKLITILGKEIDDEYNDALLKMAINDEIDKDIKIVYTPLNGTGNKPVRKILADRGFTNIIVVPEQENPDPDFTTVGYPNPEDTRAFEYAARLGKREEAEILIATDPDCDRVAMAVRDMEGYKFLNGNQTGALLINYILTSRYKKNDLPKNAAITKSIVTGDLGKVIAQKYGVTMFETLTGFKNICAKANEWEKTNEYEAIFGYEESIGYVYGTLVRDKDAVVASMLIAEMAAYYKKQGKSVLDVLNDLYEEYGHYNEKLLSIVLEGLEGQQLIGRIMDSIRSKPIDIIGDMKLIKTIDYLNDTTDAGVSDVLKYYMDDGSWYAVRPSGTEPKIKLYIYSKGKTKEDSFKKIDLIEKIVRTRMESVN